LSLTSTRQPVTIAIEQTSSPPKGPAAKIGEILNIPFERPRDRDRIMEDPEYYNLRNYALDFLYHRFAHDDE
jgi:hypothetical protein